MHKLRPAALALSAIVVLAGCSGSDEEPEATDGTESPSTSESTGGDDKPAKTKRTEPWTISAGESMTEKEANYLAVCVQWDGYQDGVPWNDGIRRNAARSGNDLAMEAVLSMADDLKADGEPSDETVEMFDEVCANVDR